MPAFTIIDDKNRYNKSSVQLTEPWVSVRLVTWIAVTMAGDEVTYGELEAMVDDFADDLHNHGQKTYKHITVRDLNWRKDPV